MGCIYFLGQFTYWYRASGSGTWQIVVSNCLTGEYDLWVGDSVIVGFRTSSAVYKAVVSDTGFRVTLIDSSYYYYGQPYNIIYTICGPVVTFSGKVLYGSQKGYTPGKINVCMYCYGHSGVDLEYYDSFDCGASVIDATVQGDLLAYQFDDGDGSYLRVYPLEDTIFGRYSKVGLWVYEPYYFLSLIDWNNFLYIEPFEKLTDPLKP